MIRDKEIERLVKYAESLGTKVVFNHRNIENSAEWHIDGSQITIFTRNQKSKSETILSLIHEIAHHVWFVHEKDRQPDLRFEEAIDRQNLFFDSSVPVPKKHRETILRREIAGTKYWEMIWKDTNIKLPKWKLFAAMEFDIWMYEQYLENGSFPMWTPRQEMKKFINDKHRKLTYE